MTHWKALIDADARAELFTELIDKHYDPAYARTYRAAYNKPNRALTFTFRPNAADGREQCACAAGPARTGRATRIGRVCCRRDIRN